MWTSRALIAAAVLVAAHVSAKTQDGAADYRAVVEQFGTTPGTAVERLLAMPPDAVARAVHDAARPGSGWTADALERALLMHGDASAALAKSQSADAGREMALADELAVAAARLPGSEWFVHRWYKVFTASANAKTLEEHWHQQPWYHGAVAVDRARQLESEGGHTLVRPDATVYDPPAFSRAVPLLEQGIAAHLHVAALHLGRIQMLRGNDTEARRQFDTAAGDHGSRVNRYLAYLFLGSMDERQLNPQGAETRYRNAVATLPRAQSGRLALAAILARTGRGDEAHGAFVDTAPGAPFDPWWTYFYIPREESSIVAELHAEVCR
jgi:hypothetical protein